MGPKSDLSARLHRPDRRRLRFRLRPRATWNAGRSGSHRSLGLTKLGDPIAFTTDSFVVDPLFFPGGDIGKLAICGTINDLAVGGAKPLYISCAAIIEEGVEVDLLRRIARSMDKTACSAGDRIVTGDTKVVYKSAFDKVFLTRSAEREGKCIFNSSVLFDARGNLVALYRKIRLFHPKEQDLFAAGDGLVVTRHANRAIAKAELEYTGMSGICGPDRLDLARAGVRGEAILLRGAPDHISYRFALHTDR